MIVRLAGDDQTSIEALVPYVKDLFPNAEVALTTSATGTKYAQALDLAINPWRAKLAAEIRLAVLYRRVFY